jgi:2'-deoxynucleoside 5'-phosphate N-hydrolase
MTAYISISYNKRKLLEPALTAIVDTLKAFKIRSFVFTDKYRFDSSQERQMMLQAMEHIDNSDFLIAETSDKAIGIGVEAGYAKAINKPIIYVRCSNAEQSTTLSGISDYQVIYENEWDLKTQLGVIIESMLRTANYSNKKTGI